MMRNLILTLLVLLCATVRAQVPLIGHWPMDEDKVTDTTGKLTAQLKNAAEAEGKAGKALLFHVDGKQVAEKKAARALARAAAPGVADRPAALL